MAGTRILQLNYLIRLHIKDKNVLVSDINNYYEIITIQRQNWKLFPWLIDGSQSVGDDPNEDFIIVLVYQLRNM